MPADPYLHERSDFPDLIRIVAGERNLLPALVEKCLGLARVTRVFQQIPKLAHSGNLVGPGGFRQLAWIGVGANAPWRSGPRH